MHGLRAFALLALAVGTGSCFLARIGPALGHAGSASEARRLLREVELAGRSVHEGRGRRCGVNKEKYFDKHVCSSSVWDFRVVRQPANVAWAALDERLVLNGWATAYGRTPAFYSRSDSDVNLWLTVGEAVLHHYRNSEQASLLREAFDALDPGETLVAVSLRYQTPTDVLRTYNCYLPC